MAAAVGKLRNLSVDTLKGVLGIACLRRVLMSAHFGSDVKRMRHGFATRNGFFAALMAEAVIGIKNVSKEPYSIQICASLG